MYYLANIQVQRHHLHENGLQKAVKQAAKAAGIEQVAFDRSGFRFHGRVKALADAAREAGLGI